MNESHKFKKYAMELRKKEILNCNGYADATLPSFKPWPEGESNRLMVNARSFQPQLASMARWSIS